MTENQFRWWLEAQYYVGTCIIHLIPFAAFLLLLFDLLRQPRLCKRMWLTFIYSLVSYVVTVIAALLLATCAKYIYNTWGGTYAYALRRDDDESAEIIAFAGIFVGFVIHILLFCAGLLAILIIGLGEWCLRARLIKSRKSAVVDSDKPG